MRCRLINWPVLIDQLFYELIIKLILLFRFAPNNFESLLKTILLQLDDVPHFLLLLPLLKLTENSNPCDPPTVLTWEKIQKGLLKSEKQQK